MRRKVGDSLREVLVKLLGRLSGPGGSGQREGRKVAGGAAEQSMINAPSGAVARLLRGIEVAAARRKCARQANPGACRAAMPEVRHNTSMTTEEITRAIWLFSIIFGFLGLLIAANLGSDLFFWRHADGWKSSQPRKPADGTSSLTPSSKEDRWFLAWSRNFGGHADLIINRTIAKALIDKLGRLSSIRNPRP